MKKTMVSILIGMVIGAIMGMHHVAAARQAEPWYIANRPEPVIYEVKLEPVMEEPEIEETEPHLLHETPVDDPDIPDEIEELARLYGFEYDISPELLEAIAWTDSRYIADVDSPDGSCKGLMQVKPSCHKDRMDLLGADDLHDASQNMNVAAHYLRELYDTYEDTATVLMIYNGDSCVNEGRISKYARNIMKLQEELEIKHKKRASDKSETQFQDTH